METRTVSKKGLATVPSKMRQLRRIKTGDKLEWQVIKKEEGLIQIRVLQGLYIFLKGKRGDPNTTYENVEHLASGLNN